MITVKTDKYKIFISDKPNTWHNFNLQPNHITGYSKTDEFSYIFTGRVRNNEALCYIQDKKGVW